MNFTTISHATGISTDNLLKAWKNAGLYEGKSPGPTGALPADKVAPFLEWIGAPKTRRKDGPATQAAAQLLAEFRAGQHQNEHVEPAKPRTVTPPAQPKPVQNRTRTTKQPDAQPITPQPVKRGIVARTFAPIIRAVTTTTKLDVVYYFTLGVACYGAWQGLGRSEMGVSFGVVYTLVSLHALGMAKDPANKGTAVAGISAVVVLEIVGFFIDLSMFNLRIWQVAKQDLLPFRSYEIWIPFWIAVILAALQRIFGGVYPVMMTFFLTSEKRDSAEKAKRDAEQSAAHVTELRAALEDAAKQWAIASGQNHFDTEKAGTLAEKYFTILNQTND